MKAIFFLFIIIITFGIIAFFSTRPNRAPEQKNSVLNPTVTINSAQFRVILAHTQQEQERGLGGRPNLPADQGMLFTFPAADRHSFWMKGMQFPLDIIFILDNKVVGIFTDLPPEASNNPNLRLYGNNLISDMVLEINSGLAKKYNIQIGSLVDFKIK